MKNLKVKSQKSNLQFKSQNFEFCLVVLTFAFLFLPSAAAACPMCKESLFDPGQLGQKIATAKGYALSIGVLLAVPFALIAGVAGLIVRSARRLKSGAPAQSGAVDTPRKTR